MVGNNGRLSYRREVIKRWRKMKQHPKNGMNEWDLDLDLVSYSFGLNRHRQSCLCKSLGFLSMLKIELMWMARCFKIKLYLMLQNFP